MSSVECRGCGHRSPAGSAFCAGCGGKLATRRCTECRADLPADASFCLHCGEPVASENRQPVAASSLVVMLCELVADPAETRSRRDAARRREAWRELCAQVVVGLEGRVVHQPGNAVIACFGPPSAHGDDAARAVDAALEIGDRLRSIVPGGADASGSELRARTAVHTTSATEPAGDLEADLDAALRFATPLLDAAPTSGVLMSDAVAERVRGRFLVEDLGTRKLPGSGATHTWCARLPMAAASRLAAPAGPVSPLVGRRLELELLLDRWRRSRAGGRAVVLRGEPGIGKTRTLSAFRDALPDEPFSWIEAQCSPFHSGTALHPVADFLERTLRLRRDDPVDSQIAALELAMRRAGFPLETGVPLFASLLSLPASDRHPALPAGREELRERTLEWLTSWLVGVALSQPAVVVFEDLQWADASTLELLGRLLEHIQKAPALVVLTARADFRVPWDEVEQLVLPPLDALEAESLAESVAEGSLPAFLVREIAAQTGGIPLLVEELTHSVVAGTASGGDPLSPDAVSDSLRGALMTRLDHLGSARSLAQLGAVLGREFPLRLLDAVAELPPEELASGVAELVSVGLLFRNDSSPGVHYRFRHALVRDAVYDSLPPDVRRHLHERIAKALDERMPDLAATQPEYVARHCDEAELDELAVRHYQRAAEAAGRRSANTEAGSHLRRCLELVAKRAPSRERDAQELSIRVALGLSMIGQRGYSDPEVVEAFALTRRLSEGVQESPETFRAFYGLATYCFATAQLESSIEFAERCLRVADTEDDSSLRLLSLHRLGLALYGWGEPGRALETLDQAIAVYEPERHRALAYVYGPDAGAVAQVFSALALIALGRSGAARRRLLAAVAAARATEHPYTLMYVLSLAALGHAQLADRDRTVLVSDELIELCTAGGYVVALAAGYLLRGWARAGASAAGRAAVAEIREGATAFARTGMIVVGPCFLGFLADAQRRTGAESGALETVEQALAESAATSVPFWEAELLRAQGEILAAREESDRALACFDQALATARDQGAHGFAVRSAASKAALLRDLGDLEGAAATLRPAIERMTGDLHDLDLETARDLVGLLHDVFGEPDGTDTPGGAEPGARAAHGDPLLASLYRTLRVERPATELAPSGSESGESIDPRLAESVAALSPRRLEVLRLLARGLTNKEIASALSISGHTAKAHVAALLETLELSNRTEAAVALARYEASRAGNA